MLLGEEFVINGKNVIMNDFVKGIVIEVFLGTEVEYVAFCWSS